MKTSSISQKIGASAINCSLVMMVASPLYPLLGVELWKLATILSFFGYNLICRKRCIGMYVVHDIHRTADELPVRRSLLARFRDVFLQRLVSDGLASRERHSPDWEPSDDR